VIAENIIESPSERNFRDDKNNNIWGIKDLEIKEKHEQHNFTIELDTKCNNCHHLQKELVK
jgi:hypothetical protein